MPTLFSKITDEYDKLYFKSFLEQALLYGKRMQVLTVLLTIKPKVLQMATRRAFS